MVVIFIFKNKALELEIRLKKFSEFLIIWISQNLAMPFWIVGHIHLSIHIYTDIQEILASLGMNMIVAFGFWLDWKQNKNKNKKGDI
jgi:hypothetical protein